MKITIPYNIFIFAWCILGLCVLSFYNVKDVADGSFSFNGRLLTELIWFLIFLLYSVAYLRNRRSSNAVEKIAEV